MKRSIEKIRCEYVASRATLEEGFKCTSQKYRGKKIPCRKEWGGYCLEPERMEFWQGRKNRLHDRFLYLKEAGEWLITRLAP